MVFMRADPLSRLLMEMVSHSLGSQELQQFREEFRAIDASHLGKVSKKDFVAALGNSEVKALPLPHIVSLCMVCRPLFSTTSM